MTKIDTTDDVFVDREEQLACFRTCVQLTGKQIYVFHGASGCGKTALRERMENECPVPKLVIEWKKSYYSYQPEGVMEDIAGLFQEADFVEFRSLQKKLRQAEINIQASGGIIIGSGATYTNVGHVTNIGINIEQAVTGPQANGLAANWLRQLTKAFFDCLVRATAKGPIVLFLHGIEMADQKTRDWVWEEFIPTIAKGCKPVRIAVFTSEALEPEGRLRSVIEVVPVPPLPPKYIIQYIELRGIVVPDAFKEVFAEGISSKRNMYEIATAVDQMLLKQEAE